jgi:hypothetical protein
MMGPACDFERAFNSRAVVDPHSLLAVVSMWDLRRTTRRRSSRASFSWLAWREMLDKVGGLLAGSGYVRKPNVELCER